MRYKFVVKDTMEEAEDECNRAGAKGWYLVTAFPETFQECCNQQGKRKVVLVLAKRED